MTTNTLIEAYVGSNGSLEIDIECFQSDGLTPYNMATAKARLSLRRGGVKFFEIILTSDDPAFAWTNRTQGTGKFTIDATPLPAGLCRYYLEAISTDNVSTPQALGYMRLIKTF